MDNFLLALLPAYRQLHSTAPLYYAESIDQIVVHCPLCSSGLADAPRRLRDAIHDLGLSAPFLAAFALALGVLLPMLTVFSPFVEQLASCGFGGSWSVPSVVLFGWSHVEKE